MRDKTASPIFRIRKKLDHALEGFLPGIYLPLYAMVTFTRIPYAAAARRAQIQDAIVFSLLAFFALLVIVLLVRLLF
jgi:kynurenine 3-monooxygenase